jgi:hypothetical protein
VTYLELKKKSNKGTKTIKIRKMTQKSGKKQMQNTCLNPPPSLHLHPSTMRSFALLSLFSAVSVVSGATPPAATRTSVKDAAAAYGYDLSAVLETVDVTGDGKLLKHVLVRGSGDTARKVRPRADVLPGH